MEGAPVILGCVVAFLGIVSAQDWEDPNLILTMSGKPAIAADGRTYICFGKTLIVYNRDMSVNWTAALRNANCARRITPIVDTAGQVYLAADRRVQIITPEPESINSKKYSISYLYNITSGGNRLGSRGISGLAASTSDAAVMFYINTGYGGLYGVTIDGIPRWTIGGNITTNETSDWMVSSFPDDSFCQTNATGCYFHFSPAVDLCDGTVYIGHSNGMIYAIDGWQPFIRWRYYIGVVGERSESCVKVGNNGIVYVGVIALQTVLAIDGQTGILIWKVGVGPMSFLTCYPRIDVSGYVFMGSADGILYSISPYGDVVKKLLVNESRNAIIQAPPFLECDGGQLYVAHIGVRTKIISYTPSETVVSYTDALTVTISQINAFSGSVLWRKVYRGNDTASGGGQTFDSTLMLAITAQHLAPKGVCLNGENRLYATCILNLTLDPLPIMSNKRFKGYFISMPMVFMGSLVAIACAYVYWSRTTRTARQKERAARRKDLGIPKTKEKLAKRRTLLEQSLELAKANFMENPNSVQYRQDLHTVLSELSFMDILIMNQAHTGASQHGIRRKLEMPQYIPTWGPSPQGYYGHQGHGSGAPSYGGIHIQEPAYQYGSPNQMGMPGAYDPYAMPMQAPLNEAPYHMQAPDMQMGAAYETPMADPYQQQQQWG